MSWQHQNLERNWKMCILLVVMRAKFSQVYMDHNRSMMLLSPAYLDLLQPLSAVITAPILLCSIVV
eukprot:m.134507 g.134507  ORF g.134507 m.134507 type:complete len:66 (-) comp13959_c0_seq2:194-391(-)